MSVVSDGIKPLTFIFEDDGLVPNNPLPFLVYKQAIDVDNQHPEVRESRQRAITSLPGRPAL